MASPSGISPAMTELVINYSVGVKADALAQYENVTASVSRTEKYNVAGMSGDEINEFWSERYAVLQEELGDRIVEKYKQMHEGHV